MLRSLTLPVLAIIVAAAPSMSAAGPIHTLTNGAITVELKNPASGKTKDQDRVDSISWINSDGVSTGNLVREGGPGCNEPGETFGQSYGTDEGTPFVIVFSGTQSTWTHSKMLKGVSTGTGLNACHTQYGTATTAYELSEVPDLFNALRLDRTITFGEIAASAGDDLRAYVPRLPYTTVLVPDSSGAIQTFDVSCCGAATRVQSWNGKWFAEENKVKDGGVMVIRDRVSTAPAYLALDNDAYSSSDNSSIVLERPSAGWTGTVEEVEWLCFYDHKSWSAARRAAGRLPKGCKVITP